MVRQSSDLKTNAVYQSTYSTHFLHQTPSMCFNKMGN